MTITYVQKGEIIDFVPAAAKPGNSVYIEGVLIGVVCADTAANATGALAIEGVFDLPKKAGAAIAAGATLTWSVADSAFIVGAGVTGDTHGGAVSVNAAVNADTIVRVKLCPGTGATVA